MIRDEISKLLDIRIPPNGYRRYIKEVGRTGGFQDTQRDDCLIVLCQAVEELQKFIEGLQHTPTDLPAQPVHEELQVPKVFVGDPAPNTMITSTYTPAIFECVTCGISFKQRIGLEGHKRGKGHKDAVSNAA